MLLDRWRQKLGVFSAAGIGSYEGVKCLAATTAVGIGHLNSIGHLNRIGSLADQSHIALLRKRLNQPIAQTFCHSYSPGDRLLPLVVTMAIVPTHDALVAELATLLTSLTTPDTATVRAAELRLKTLSASPSTVLPLAAISAASPEPHTRHLAAVLLRRALRRHWCALPAPDAAAIKATILSRLAAEESPAPRRGLAVAAAAVCRAEDALWPDLTAAAVALSRSPDPALRVSAFKVFDAVADAVPAKLTPYAPTVAALISTGLQDPFAAVRIAALDAYASAAHAVSTYATDEHPWTAIGGLIPAVASVARQAAEAVTSAAAIGDPHADPDPDGEVARILCVVFEVLSWLSETGGGTVMRPHFSDVFSFALQIAAPAVMPQAARDAAVEYICNALRAKPKTLKKAGLVKVVLYQAVKMALQYVEDDDDYDNPDVDDSEGLDPVQLALRIVYNVSARGELARMSFGEIMAVCPRLMANDTTAYDLPAAIPAHHATTVAFRLVGAIAEGCASELTAHAEDIAVRLASGAQDATLPAHARGHAMDSITCVMSALDTAEMNDDSRARIADVCLGAVLAGMRENSLCLKRHACLALEPVLDLFDDDSEVLRERMSEVMSALDGLGSDAAIEAVTAAAIIAENLGADFMSTSAYKGIVDGMATLMSRTAEADIPARSAATQAAGVIIAACQNLQVAESLAACAISGLDIDDAGLREATFDFFSRMSSAYGGRVAFFYGQRLLMSAIASIDREDVVYVRDGKDGDVNVITGDANGHGLGHESGPGADVDDNDDDDDEGGSFHVRTALLDEKAKAVSCVGAMATSVATREFLELASGGTPDGGANASAVLSFLTRAGEALDPMVTNFHEDVRAAGTRADVAYALAAETAQGISLNLKFGPSDSMQRTVSRLTYTLQEDDDSFVVTVALHACATFCSKATPDVLSQYKDGILQAVEVLIEGKAVCQMSLEDDDEDTYELEANKAALGGDAMEMDDGDEVATLIDGICEVLSAMARAIRGHFANDFFPLLPKITAKLITRNAPPRNVSLVVGMLADVFLFMNFDRCTGFEPPLPQSAEVLAIADIVDQLAGRVLPLAIQGARGEGGQSKTLQRNSVFLVGVLFAAVRITATAVRGQVVPALQLLEGLVQRGKDHDGALVDNAAGAIARILIANAMPVDAPGSKRNALLLALSAVPIDDDPTENASVARAVVAVAAAGDFGAIEMMADAVVACLATVILSSVEQAETEASVKSGAAQADEDEDPNDIMARLDDSERAHMVQLLVQVRQRCGDGCFARLELESEDQARLSALMLSC
jgi:importin-4